MKDVFYERLDIEKNTNESQQNLFNQERKVRILDNLMDVAEQSLDDYFDKVRSMIDWSCCCWNEKSLAYGKCSTCYTRTLQCNSTDSSWRKRTLERNSYGYWSVNIRNSCSNQISLFVC